MRITASRGEIVAAFTVDPDSEILVFSSGGNIIRMGAREISSQGRDATGVRVARLEPGETVSAVAPVLEAPPLEPVTEPDVTATPPGDDT
jgi:DNA gyrase subunit A